MSVKEELLAYSNGTNDCKMSVKEELLAYSNGTNSSNDCKWVLKKSH